MESNHVRSRPSAASEPDNRKDSAAPWPKRGPAGQIQAAKRTAPDDAGPLEILAVAHAAHKRGTDPATVWQGVDGR